MALYNVYFSTGKPGGTGSPGAKGVLLNITVDNI